MTSCLLLIDDDELTRTMLGVLLEMDGWEVLLAQDGNDALRMLEARQDSIDVVLTDLQMPGLAGENLAMALRERLPAAKLLAMTATVKSQQLEEHAGVGGGRGFDAVLQKPLDAAAVRSALAGDGQVELGARPQSAPELDEDVWGKLQRSMSTKQVEALFAFALEDAAKRVEKMRSSAEQEDDAAVRREAHALKGSAGMIGAARLQQLSSRVETRGLSIDVATALDEILLSISRLRSMLAERTASR